MSTGVSHGGGNVALSGYVIARPRIFRATFTLRPSHGRGDGLAAYPAAAERMQTRKSSRRMIT